MKAGRSRRQELAPMCDWHLFAVKGLTRVEAPEQDDRGQVPDTYNSQSLT